MNSDAMIKLMLGLAATVLVARAVGLMKWETWILVPLLVGCSAWMHATTN